MKYKIDTNDNNDILIWYCTVILIQYCPMNANNVINIENTDAI